MRTILITLALLAMSIVGKAQSIDTILEQFKNEKNVTLVDMPKDLIALAASSSGDKDAAKYLKSIDRLRVLSLEEADKTVRDNFFAAFKKLDLKDYNDVVRATSDGEKVRILTKEGKNDITSLVICAIDADDGDCALVVIDGHINPNDIDSIINSQK
ncbi:hypothetical protein HMPREF0653_01649 [Prevotella disiens JCM 6334 = ATCC 29426]|uniref:DUF4252 domain-containing protein n=2 Tax=Prevotella disiens TaxID=28130 RepID=A0A379DWL7_9BACT|nr:DUF4252 domain-containing protein [Prevotella disiens]ERJ76032.1 hypothetical protein HMPREF0653_01649 [Prevotella disiens JCM 6334 = ATCC 29426]SUB84372.1 Uncharacterised protein [Prevotella disiens]